MGSALRSIALYINDSTVHDLAVAWLRTVPGLPPVIQTVHIVSVAAIMASVVFINLRILGWALPSQDLREMQRRLLPWAWTALILLLLSGLVFVVARPLRYFVNPVFGWKIGLLLAAGTVTTLTLRLLNRSAAERVSTNIKIFASTSLALWIGVVLAGRWIAYADYLFPPN